MWHRCGARVTLSPLRGRGKGWWLLGLSECHAEASAHVCRVDASGAEAVPRGAVRTNSSEFALWAHGKSQAHPHSDSPACSASPPHRRAEGWGRATTAIPGPCPCSQSCRSRGTSRVLGQEQGAGTLCVLIPMCHQDEAPEDVAMPGPIPARPGCGISTCLGCVQGLPELWPPSHQGPEKGWQ